MKRAWFAAFAPSHQAEGWRKRVRNVTEDLVASLGEYGEPRDGIRAKVIQAAREALGDRPSRQLIEPMMVNLLAGDGLGPFAEPSFPGMIRDELDSAEWRWETPFGAESVMAVVQGTLDGSLRGPVPPYWAGCLEMGARIVAVREFQAADPRDQDDRAELLARVMVFGRESLSDAADDSPDATSWDGGPISFDEWLPLPDLFRHLIRSLDHRDPAVVKVALGIIEAAARDELGRHVPGQGPSLRA